MMASDGVMNVLPPAPANFCFNKHEFTNDNFSADKFVREHRKHVSLEALRDDLAIYLKVLRSAMIELINKDYADFVNLSTNLVGLDKSIANLSVPLGQLREEVMSAKSALDEALLTSHEQLKKHGEICETKVMLQRIMTIIQGVDKAEYLMQLSSLSTMSDMQAANMRHWPGDLIERVATELNQIQFYLSKVCHLPVIEQMNKRVDRISSVLQEHLEQSFLEGLSCDDSRMLKRVLRIYAAIDKTKEVELLFRNKVVRPHMEQVICEKLLHSEGIKKMFDVVMEFVPLKCKKLLEVTQGPSDVKGYDFLVNSVWPEVVASLETRVFNIFNAGNPKMFHECYLASISFLEQFEHACGSHASIKRLRLHPSYNTFLDRWNLMVYYQIRFQEIAGEFEVNLSLARHQTDGLPFELQATHALWSGLHSCWSRNIFLHSLSHRFWKLTLQLLGRYVTWVTQVIQDKLPRSREESPISDWNSPVSPPSNTVDDNQSTRPVSNGLDSTFKEGNELPILVQWSTMVHDIEQLRIQVPFFFSDVVLPCLQAQGFSNADILQGGINDALENLQRTLPGLGNNIVKLLSRHCVQHVKSVSDIPRLYRKTNRDVPSKPSVYVTNMLKPAELFMHNSQNVLGASWAHLWLQEILETITQQYVAATRDVLTSVKKMEDSLKRLKRARDKTATSGGGSTGVSDDGKIRLQLFLDVEYFGQKIESLGVSRTAISGYDTLVELVESARNSPNSIS